MSELTLDLGGHFAPSCSLKFAEELLQGRSVRISLQQHEPLIIPPVGRSHNHVATTPELHPRDKLCPDLVDELMAGPLAVLLPEVLYPLTVKVESSELPNGSAKILKHESLKYFDRTGTEFF